MSPATASGPEKTEEGSPALYRALRCARMAKDGRGAPVLMVYPSGGMGEDAGRDAGSPGGDTQRVTIAEAARILGVKEPAIRKRMQRGTLEHDKGEDGRTYVYLEAGISGGMDTGGPASYPGQDERIGELKDQIDYLRDQRAEEREARRRADTIIAQITQANATLAARIPELEAPTEPRESPEALARSLLVLYPHRSSRSQPRSARSGVGGSAPKTRSTSS